MESTPLGRDDELDVIDRFLERAWDRFGSLVVEGEPGIGKTTLWREGIRRATAAGFLVLSSRPAEAEAKLSYSGLGDVLERLPEHAFAGLPVVQREALDVALLRVPTGAENVEPRAVAAGAGLRSWRLRACRRCWLRSTTPSGWTRRRRQRSTTPFAGWRASGSDCSSQRVRDSRAGDGAWSRSRQR
jgi:hypothetical protein